MYARLLTAEVEPTAYFCARDVETGTAWPLFTFVYRELEIIVEFKVFAEGVRVWRCRESNTVLSGNFRAHDILLRIGAL